MSSPPSLIAGYARQSNGVPVGELGRREVVTFLESLDGLYLGNKTQKLFVMRHKDALMDFATAVLYNRSQYNEFAGILRQIIPNFPALPLSDEEVAIAVATVESSMSSFSGNVVGTDEVKAYGTMLSSRGGLADIRLLGRLDNVLPCLIAKRYGSYGPLISTIANDDSAPFIVGDFGAMCEGNIPPFYRELLSGPLTRARILEFFGRIAP
jgi:hypothetical protein